MRQDGSSGLFRRMFSRDGITIDIGTMIATTLHQHHALSIDMDAEREDDIIPPSGLEVEASTFYSTLYNTKT